MSTKTPSGGKFNIPAYSSSARLDRQTVMENALDQVKIRQTMGKDEGLGASQIFIPEFYDKQKE